VAMLRMQADDLFTLPPPRVVAPTRLHFTGMFGRRSFTGESLKLVV
jgi:hypothetical protein